MSLDSKLFLTVQKAMSNMTATPRMVRILDIKSCKFVFAMVDNFAKQMPTLPPVFRKQQPIIFEQIQALSLTLNWLRDQRKNYDAGDVGVIAP